MSFRLWSFGRVLFVVTPMVVSALWSQAARANNVEVDIGFFYSGLAPYGQWTNHPSHGWVWYPAGVEVGWRPYADGHWVYTDEYGWVWDSDYEWGWAPFHYGRWFYEHAYGWLWVPGMEWGPAWVTWRCGGSYVGWAPLPPMVTWSMGTGFNWGGFNATTPTFMPAWIFVEEGHFAEPEVRQHILMPARNVEIVRMTQDTTNLTVAAGRVRNRSVDVAQVERVTGQPIPRMQVKEVTTVEAAKAQNRRPGDVSLFRPVVKPGRPEQMPPVGRGDTREAGQSPPVERHRSQAADRDSRQRTEQGNTPRPTRDVTRESQTSTRAPQNQQSTQQQVPQQKQKRAVKKRAVKKRARPHN